VTVRSAPTRRRADGGPSARALLLTILGRHVVPAGGEAWTATLVEALGAAGVEEPAARQAVARTAADGLLERLPAGRRTRWRVTPTGAALLTVRWQRLQRSLEPPARWDGRWSVVAVLAPITDRRVRAQLGARLAFEGFGPLQPLLWVAADARADDGAAAVLARLDLAGAAARFVAELTEPADVVGHAFDLQAAAEANRRFVAEVRSAEPRDDRAAFALAASLPHRWREVLRADPGLPTELLPARWPGAAARHRFTALWVSAERRADAFYATLTQDEARSTT
jgi:phenylacetic acid degradation operon negative regulatory protein